MDITRDKSNFGTAYGVIVVDYTYESIQASYMAS